MDTRYIPGAAVHFFGAFVDVDGLHDAQREHSVVVIAVRHHCVHRYASWHVQGRDVHTIRLVIGFAQRPAGDSAWLLSANNGTAFVMELLMSDARLHCLPDTIIYICCSEFLYQRGDPDVPFNSVLLPLSQVV